MFILLHLAKGSLFFTWLRFFHGYGVIDLVGIFCFFICLLLSSPFFRVHQNVAYPKNRPYQFLDSYVLSDDSLLSILVSVWLLRNSCDKIISKNIGWFGLSLIVNDVFQCLLAILAQSVFHVASILAMGILYQALQIILFAMG